MVKNPLWMKMTEGKSPRLCGLLVPHTARADLSSSRVCWAERWCCCSSPGFGVGWERSGGRRSVQTHQGEQPFIPALLSAGA